MKFFKAEKGTFGYINKQRINEILRTVFMFACAIGLYVIGFVTLKTNKNIWTILAVLSVLPAAKSAVSMIMFFRFSSIENSLYESIEVSRGAISALYELVFTTTEKSYFVKCCACCDNTVILLLENKNKGVNSKELKDHIVSAALREGLNSYSFKIYLKESDFINRLTEMDNNLNGSEDTSSKAIFNLFKAITI